MNDVDKAAAAALNDETLFREFLLSNKQFIVASAYKASSKYITDSDDEWLVAIEAFAKAVRTYNTDKGHFLPFADMLIKQMLIDYYRSEKKHKYEFPVNPNVFDCEIEEDDEQLGLKLSIAKNVVYFDDYLLKDEIEAANNEFRQYGFSFYDLYKYSPKSSKTKKACKKAVLHILENDEIYKNLLAFKRLPLKEIQNNTGLPRKLLERHRIYIIAVTVILSGEYPGLALYVSYFGKDEDRV